MNPTSNETAGMQLPPPVVEQIAEANPAKKTSAAPEQAPTAPEKAGAASPPPQISVPTINLPLPPDPVPVVSPAIPSVSLPAAAAAAVIGDEDLIEKEWVNKAKHIVAQNRHDPYKQSEELTVFRADYMKKHYDKNIKLSS